MSGRAEVTFPSGGEQCAAYLYRPSPAEQLVPCVVMAHGFTGTRDERLPAYAERFVAAGLAVLVFDYRHFGESGGEPRQLVDIRRQLEDWKAAIGYARGLEGIDADRIALWGTSFSGGHVVRVASEDSRIAAVVSQVPFSTGLEIIRINRPGNMIRATLHGIADQLGALLGRPPRLIPAVAPPGEFAAMTAPEADPGFHALVPPDSLWRNEFAARVMLRMGSYSPARRAARLAMPLHVCVGDRDETTPPEPAARMAARAPQGELVRYPVGHFDIYVGEPFERAVADQTAFLVRHLQPLQTDELVTSL